MYSVCVIIYANKDYYYYNENKTDCYLLLLDALKAFDRLNIINYSIDCVTGICVQLYYDY